MVFGLSAKYLLAMLLFAAGLFLVGCGSTVCWLRFGRNRGKSVDDIRREHDKTP